MVTDLTTLNCRIDWRIDDVVVIAVRQGEGSDLLVVPLDELVEREVACQREAIEGAANACERSNAESWPVTYAEALEKAARRFRELLRPNE